MSHIVEPQAATSSPTSKTSADFAGRVREQVAATMPKGRRGRRQFEIPQSAADLFGRVADSIREHGITPEQAQALREVIRTAGPTGAARQVLDLIEAGTYTAEPGHYPWCAPGACAPVYENGDETEHEGTWLRLSEDIDCSNSSIKVRHPGHGFLAVQLGHSAGMGNSDGTPCTPEVLLGYEGESCTLDAQQFDAFIDQVADFHAGLIAMRRQMDAKRAAK